MSGIVGAFHFDKTQRIEPSILQRSHDAIRSFGLDGGGIVSVAGCGLGQAQSRLDEAHGTGSPMWDAERRLVAVFDGVLRGRRELEETLDKHGHRLRTKTQVELVLAAYRQWGVDCVDHLEGTFALAVFDRRAHTLYLARDPVGVRPLYIYQDTGRLCFSSGVQGILSQDRIPRILDPRAAEDFLAVGFFPRGQTGLRDVRAVAPGHALYADRHRFREWAYWRPEFRSERGHNLVQHVHLFLSVLDKTTEPVTNESVTALSGGVGSAVVAAATHDAGSRIPAVTVHRKWADERRAAAETAKALDIPYSEVEEPAITPDAWLNLVTDADGPVDANGAGWMTLAQALASKASIAWTGAGNGWIFGSSARYRSACRRRPWIFSAPAMARRWLGLGDALEGLAPNPSVQAAPVASERWSLRHRRLYTADFRYGLGDYRPGAPRAPAYEDLSVLAALQRRDVTSTLPYGLLAILARIERLTGMQLRHPLADVRVIDLLFRTPDRYRLDVDSDRVILRRAARRWLPPQVTQRPAISSRAPVAAWLRGPLMEVAQAELFSDQRTGLFAGDALRRAWYRLLLGGSQEARTLWRVAAFEAWARRTLRSPADR